MQTLLSWIAPQADSPSVGVVHVVLAVQPDRLSVQLDGLFVLLGGKVLVAKPVCRCDTWCNSKSRDTGKMINEPARKIFRSKRAQIYLLRPVEIDRPAREEKGEDNSSIQYHPLIIVCHHHRSRPTLHTRRAAPSSQLDRIRGTPTSNRQLTPSSLRPRHS